MNWRGCCAHGRRFLGAIDFFQGFDRHGPDDLAFRIVEHVEKPSIGSCRIESPKGAAGLTPMVTLKSKREIGEKIDRAGATGTLIRAHAINQGRSADMLPDF